MAARIMMLNIAIMCFILAQSLTIRHDFQTGMKPFSYQTFAGVAMYSANDTNKMPHYTPIPVDKNSKTYIDFDLILQRNIVDGNVFIELIVIPDTNIYDIGFRLGGNLHLCCNVEVFGMYGCDENHIGELVIPKRMKGLYREKISFDNTTNYHLQTRVPIPVSSIYVFALATCDSHLQSSYGTETVITFTGTSQWINLYGLPANIYPYLPFYGWLCVFYCVLFSLWNIINKFHSKMLFVSVNLILLLSLMHALFWYIHLLNMNANEYIDIFHEYISYDTFGLIINSIRGVVTIIIFIALCNGYGVFKTLKSLSKKQCITVIILVIGYWIIVFCNVQIYAIFNDVHFKTRTIASGVEILIGFIVSACIGFGLLQSTIRELRRTKIIFKQTTIELYKSIGILLAVSLSIVIICSCYQIRIAFNESSAAQWNIIWFLDCWTEILFSASVTVVMIILLSSDNCYALLINDNDQETQLTQITQIINTINTHQSDDFEGIKP